MFWYFFFSNNFYFNNCCCCCSLHKSYKHFVFYFFSFEFVFFFVCAVHWFTMLFDLLKNSFCFSFSFVDVTSFFFSHVTLKEKSIQREKNAHKNGYNTKSFSEVNKTITTYFEINFRLSVSLLFLLLLVVSLSYAWMHWSCGGEKSAKDRKKERKLCRSDKMPIFLSASIVNMNRKWAHQI